MAVATVITIRGFRVLGFRGLGFRGLGFRVHVLLAVTAVDCCSGCRGRSNMMRLANYHSIHSFKFHYNCISTAPHLWFSLSLLLCFDVRCPRRALRAQKLSRLVNCTTTLKFLKGPCTQIVYIVWEFQSKKGYLILGSFFLGSYYFGYYIRVPYFRKHPYRSWPESTYVV